MKQLKSSKAKLEYMKEYQKRPESKLKHNLVMNKYLSNPEVKESRKQYKSKWEAENRDRVNKCSREWCRSHPEKVKKYRSKQRDEPYKAWRRQYRRDNPEKQYSTWSIKVKIRDNYTCKQCGGKENLHAHHVKPKSLYPLLAKDINNGVTLCIRCHMNHHKKYGLMAELEVQ